MAPILRLFALVLALLAAAALVPALVGLGARDGSAPVFIATAVASLFLAGAVHLAVRGRPGRLRRLHLFAALGVLWLLVPIMAAPAVAVLAPMAFGGAVLEALSAFTTTGLSSVGEAPASLHVWLALLQWAGGLLTLVAGIAVLAPAGVAGLPDRAVHPGETVEAIDLLDALGTVAPIYGLATLVAFIAMLGAGASLLSAGTLATAVISTGAHVPPEAHEFLAASVPGRWVTIPFLLWSATSVRWHKALVSRRIHAAPEQGESLILFGYWAVLGLVMGAYFFRGAAGLHTHEAVLDGLFGAASLISTTGLAPHRGAFDELPPALVLAVAFVGGGALSVSGGLKILRVRAMLLRARGDLMRLVYPNLVQPSRTGEGGVGSAMRGVWVGMVALCLTFAAALILIAGSMPSFEAAVSTAVSALSNTGPLLDGTPGPEDFDLLAAVGAGFAMIAGRLETVGAFVIIHLAFWRT